MYYYASSFVVLSALMVTSFGYPILDDIFPGFLRNSNLDSQAKQSDIVKRRVYEENGDSSLKQISLQSLIGDLEQSLYNSAASVSDIAHNKEAVVEEVTTEHAVIKRQTEVNLTVPNVEAVSSNVHDDSTESLPYARKIVLQTTERVPGTEGQPSHVVIDHISVQPHFATIREPSTTLNDNTNSTQISISETEIKASGLAVTTQSDKVTIKSSETATTSFPTLAEAGGDSQHIQDVTELSVKNILPDISTVSSSSVSSTTTTPVVQLKEAEKELKTKVAEIEAEPVILSARV